MTQYDEAFAAFNDSSVDLATAHRRATQVALRTIRTLVAAVSPDATGFRVGESDQGPWLWFESIIDPTAVDGERPLEDLDEELQSALTLIASLIDDGEWRSAWEPIASRTQAGWEIQLDDMDDTDKCRGRPPRSG